MAEAEYDEKNDPNSPNYAPDEDLPPEEGFDLDGEPKKPRKRRKWPWVLLVLLILLGVLVLFLPTIANAPPVRAFVLEKLNDQLNGQVEITDWSLGWTGNTEITGVRITQNGAQILAARRLFTELSLFDMVKGDWNLGTTVVEDLTFVLKQFPDGTNNFQKLLKGPPSTEPITLPDLRGDVDVVFWGSITQPDGTVITFDRSHLNAKFDSINGPIAHDLDVTARIAGTSPGKLAAKGQVDLFENGRVSFEQLAMDESAQIGEFPLDAIAVLFPPDAPITTLQGLTSGKLQLQFKGLNEIFVQGELASEGFAIGGPALGGDVYRDPSIAMVIPETRYDRASGRLRTRQVGSQSQQIVIKGKQLGSIALAANAPLPAIANVLANRQPGADGRLAIAADLNAVAANQLKNLLPLPQGLRITSGVLHYDSELLLDEQAARVEGQLNVTELGGIDRDGNDVYAEPIYLTFNAVSLGGNGPIPNLRDLTLALRSGFATLQGKGQSLAQVTLNGTADLAKFHQQLGQFIQLDLRQLAGNVVFNVSTDGDLTAPGGTSRIKADATATNLVYQPQDGAAISQPWARATASGQLVRGDEQFVDAIDDATLAAQTGNEQDPTVDLLATADIEFPLPPANPPGIPAAVDATYTFAAPRYEIARLNVNVPAAQREFPALLEFLQQRGLTFTQGTVTAKGAGSYAGGALTLASFNAAAQDLALQQERPGQQPVTVLSDYGGAIDVANLTVRTDQPFTPVSAQQLEFSGEFANATVKDAQLRLAGATPEAAVSPLDMIQQAAVTWNVTDLPRAASVVRAFVSDAPEEGAAELDAQPATQPADADAVQVAHHPLHVRSGTLRGSLRVDRSDEGIAIAVDELIGQQIVLERGKGRFGPEEIDLKAAALIRTSAPGDADGQTVADQIQEIRISQLQGDLAVASVALDAPIVITDPAGTTQASGAVKLAGQVRTLSDLLRTLEYLSPDADDPFGGDYTLTQRLATDQDVISLAGEVSIQNFVAGRFRERLVQVVNDVRLDQKNKAMNVRAFTVNLEESDALSLNATGTIAEYDTQRRFDKVRASLSYDAAKLLDLIRPLLDPATQEHIKTLRLAGVVRDQLFVIEGSYPDPETIPADAKQQEPIQYLTASGQLAFEAFEFEGLPGKNLVIPLLLDNGRIATVYPDADDRYPQPAMFSRGTLDIGGLQLHLTANVPRISAIREDYKLLDRVVVNRGIVERYLGQAHPLFAGTDEARGLLTVTVNELERLPVGERLKRPGSKEEGIASFTLALTDLRLRTAFLGQVLSTLRVVQLEPDGTIRASIPDADFAIDRGVVTSNLALNLGGTVLGFREGAVRLRDNQILSLSMLIPKNLIPALRNEPLIKEFITVPVTGTLSRPQFDIIKAAIQSSGLADPLDLLKRLEGNQDAAGGSDRIGTPTDQRDTQPQRPQQNRQPRERQRPRDQRPRGTIGRQPR